MYGYRISGLFLLVLLPPPHAGLLQGRASRPGDAPKLGLTTKKPDDAPLRFAVIGDYGLAGPEEQEVAVLVKSWNPNLIITTGDNNYPDGGAATIDQNIGQYYHDYIFPYVGSYGPGAGKNAFFPSLGNHDWYTPGAQPYLNYFELPGNERYYDFRRGPVHFFAVDSDANEPHGNTSTSVQGQWLQDALANSTAPFQFVYMHHAPYSTSSTHGSTANLKWPFALWGADAVFTGHFHVYERSQQGSIPYFVNGVGGKPPLYPFGIPIAGSQVRFNSDHGAMLVDANKDSAKITFVSLSGVMDTYTVVPNQSTPNQAILLHAGSNWSYLDDGSNQGTAWKNHGFDDSGWATGPAPLGYGNGWEATVVSFGPDPNNKYPTTYFRCDFPVADPSLYKKLKLRIKKDDGVNLFLNGVEVARFNLPFGSVSYLDLAPYVVETETQFVETYIDPRRLRAGNNVLAAEIHQFNVTSSDIALDAALVGEF